jgi:uncharacterized membrane protein HdeD (DUF308 family)
MQPTKRIRLETAALRTLMIIMAIIAVATGLFLLTSPLAVPITVGIWISAAAMVFLGIWGRLPQE